MPATYAFEIFQTNALTFAQGETKTIAHNLNTLNPAVQINVSSGTEVYFVNSVDQNTITVTSLGSGVVTITCQGGVATSTSDVLPANLVAFWKANEGQGQFIKDSLGSNSDQMTAPSIVWHSVSGFPVSVSVPVLGSSGNPAGSNASVLFAANQPFSVSLWFSTSATPNNYNGLFGSTTSAGVGWYVRFGTGTDANTFQFIFSDANQAHWIYVNSAGTNITLNAIHHLVVIYNGSCKAAGVTFYFDGNPINATPLNPHADDLTSNAVVATPGTLGIGSGAPNYGTPLAGLTVAYVRLYDVAIASVDVATLFAAGPK